MNYEELCEEVKLLHLPERRYGLYFLYCLVVTFCFFLSLYILSLTDSMLLQILNGVFFAFVMVQAGMMSHDFYHHQVLRSKRLNKIWGSVLFGFFVGVCGDGWHKLHDRHHKYVNHATMDSDLDIPFIFGEAQLASKPLFVKKHILPIQHIIFFLVLPLIYMYLIVWSWIYIIKNFSLITALNGVLIILHMMVVFSLPFILLPVPVAIAFLLTTTFVGGIYAGSVFAPNHKGEEVLASILPATWLEQVMLTRNLHPSWLRFIMFGGLNYQIEHHLFSDMPRFNYLYIHPVVKKYCQKHDIRYMETTYGESMRSIYSSLYHQAKLHKESNH